MSALAERVRKKDSAWAAPRLWRSEMRNTLMLYRRQGKLELVEIQAHMKNAELLLLGREFDVESDRVLDLANRSSCTSYDCEFAYLAEKLNVLLVTSNKKLLAAFPAIARSMDAFASSIDSD